MKRKAKHQEKPQGRTPKAPDADETLVIITNLNFATTEQDFRACLAHVTAKAFLINDRKTNKSRGIGIASVSSASSEVLVSELNNLKLDGRAMRVQLASRSVVFFAWFKDSLAECPTELRELAKAVRPDLAAIKR